MTILITVAPLDGVAETRTTLAFSDADDERLTGLNGLEWWPGITQLPALNREGWNGDWTNGIFLPQAAFNISSSSLLKAAADAPAWRWTGAPVNIYRGEAGDPWASFELLFTGLALSAALEEGSLKVTCQVESEPFEEKVLNLKYDGRGGAGGVTDLKERMKPAVLGYVRNIEPIMIDTVNNVFQVHGYGPIEGFVGIYERGINFGPSSGNFASYGALVGATIPEGYWGTCLAEGMFRLGAPPAGLITCDVKGDNTGGFHQTTAAIMRRLTGIAAVDPSRLDDTSLDAFEADVPYPINVYLTEPSKLIDVLSELALPCNANASLSWLGLFQITRFAAVPAPIIRLDAQGREKPAILNNAEASVSPPYTRMQLQYARCWRVQSKDELALDDNQDVIPVTIWRHYPEQPETPAGDNVPVNWHDAKPAMSRPVLFNGAWSFGPVWESHAKQKGGVTQEGAEWSEPRLDDAYYKGFTHAGIWDSDLALGGADSMRLDGADYTDTRYIQQPIAGPFRLRWWVKDQDMRCVVGLAVTDPAVLGLSLSEADIFFGIKISPTSVSMGLSAAGVYPFLDTSYTQSNGGVPTYSEYAIISNGEIIDYYVNRVLVRSTVVPRDLIGDTFWPVFHMESWANAYGTDSDIYGIEWFPGVTARQLDFPIATWTGPLRRMLEEEGFEVYAPFLGVASDAALIEAKSFKGGGVLECQVESSGPAGGTTIIELQTLTSNIGRIELDSDMKYRCKIGGTTKKSGSWADGDSWRLSYLGRRTYFYKNGALLKKKKVTKGQSVVPRFSFANLFHIYNMTVVPANEEEYNYKGSALSSGFALFTDASPTNAGGYTIIGTTPDLPYSVSADDEDGDEFRISASYAYELEVGGTAVNYTPDPKVEISYDAGASWTNIAGTWSPTPATALPGAGYVTSTAFTAAANEILMGSGNVRLRLVAKNLTTGTYTVTPLSSSFVQGEWIS